MATSTSGPDWAQTFAEFHARHRSTEGKKLVFTAVFNTAMNGFIVCPEVPLLWRVLAWIWRHSWGNNSDFCVNWIGGDPVGQQACADEFGVDKQRIHDCVSSLRVFNFVLSSTGHKLYPVDDPAGNPSQTANSENPESPVLSGLFEEFLGEWKVRSSADFEELESAEATVKRIRIDRLESFRKWKKGRTKHAQAIVQNQPSIQEQSAGGSFIPPSESNDEQHARQNPPVDEGGQTQAQAEALLMQEIRHMQETYPNSTFAKPLLNPENPGDVGLIKRILRELGSRDEQYLIGYLVHVAAEFKGIALGGQLKKSRAPGEPNGPKGVGLLVTWAHDYADRNRARREAVQESDADERLQRETRVTWAREHWHKFSVDERAEAISRFPELAENPETDERRQA